MTTKKQPASPNLKDNAPEGLALTDAEKAEARAEGAKEAEKEAAADTYRYMTDGNLPGDPPAHQYHGADEIMQWEPLLGLGIDAFTDRIAEDHDAPVPEEKVVGLLRLERNGQNRTPFVKALMERLGINGIAELRQVAPGGPDYTNDVTPVTQL